MRQPGVEPGSPAWKAGILTVGLLTLGGYVSVLRVVMNYCELLNKKP